LVILDASYHTRQYILGVHARRAWSWTHGGGGLYQGITVAMRTRFGTNHVHNDIGSSPTNAQTRRTQLWTHGGVSLLQGTIIAMGTRLDIHSRYTLRSAHDGHGAYSGESSMISSGGLLNFSEDVSVYHNPRMLSTLHDLEGCDGLYTHYKPRRYFTMGSSTATLNTIHGLINR